MLYSGKEEHHVNGVGIILSNTASRASVKRKPASERIITTRLHIRHAKVTIVQVFASTEFFTPEEKDDFYNQLQRVR